MAISVTLCPAILGVTKCPFPAAASETSVRLWGQISGVDVCWPDGSITESAKVDRPIAGLLEDLAQRGLLEDTLVDILA